LSYDPYALGHVAAKFGITTPTELARVLSKLRAPPTIEIRDHKNHDRLLGTIPLEGVKGFVASNLTHFRFNFIPHTAPRLRPYSDHEPCLDPIAVVTLSFRKEWVGGHLEKHVVLVTDAGLGLLLQWKDFRLPGETEEQAEHRHWSQAR